ncbi:MAG TPA: hypothetical protein PLI31_00580 [Methanoregulaceae archaeon]|nr:hypothetical protein [Methanoregulaceae archaeon]
MGVTVVGTVVGDVVTTVVGTVVGDVVAIVVGTFVTIDFGARVGTIVVVTVVGFITGRFLTGVFAEVAALSMTLPVF